MKKLLTMMVSCASALFAMADVTPLSGTNFESYGAEPNGAAIPLNINKDDAGGEAARYWYSATSTEGIVDAAVTNERENAYLILDTSDVLQRTINSYAGGNFQSMAIGNGIYFDSMVQFTATEDDVTPGEGDKLVVWLKAVEGTPAVGTDGEEGYQPPVSGSTNLVITAGNGFYEGGDKHGRAIPTHFFTSKAIESGSWHKLTIKAFVDGEQTYFNVFIDGELISGAPESGSSINKFQSLVAGGLAGSDTITSVGFKGTGAVDEVYFYDSNPLVQTFPLSITAPENCTIAGCLVNGEVIEIDSESNTYLVDVKAENVMVAVVAPAGYTVTNNGAIFEDETWFIPVDITDATANTPFSFTVTVEANEVPAAKPFSITIGETTTTYETLAEAFAAAEAGATIKLTADATVAEWLKVDKNVVLDLNGCTLTEQVDPEDSDYGAIYVKLNCQLTITDSSENKNGKIASNGDIVIGNYGTVIVEAGTIESGDVRDNDVSIYNMNYAGTHIGTANINGGAVESVWNCGIVTVATGASVTYLDNSGKATIDDAATVTTVVLMDGKDAQGVEGAGTIIAPEGLDVKSGVVGYTATYSNDVWSLVEDSDEPELPEVKPDGDNVTETVYNDAAKECLETYFPKASEAVPAPALAVVINGEELFGNAAVAAINDVADKFTGNPFDETGKINLVFKVDDVMKALAGTEGGYTLTVGTATLKTTYKVAPKFIDLANPGVEIQDPGADATAKFFKLVIREKSVQ